MRGRSLDRAFDRSHKKDIYSAEYHSSDGQLSMFEASSLMLPISNMQCMLGMARHIARRYRIEGAAYNSMLLPDLTRDVSVDISD